MSAEQSFGLFRLFLSMRFRNSDVIRAVASGSRSVELLCQVKFSQVLLGRIFYQGEDPHNVGSPHLGKKMSHPATQTRSPALTPCGL